MPVSGVDFRPFSFRCAEGAGFPALLFRRTEGTEVPAPDGAAEQENVRYQNRRMEKEKMKKKRRGEER